MTEGSVPRRTRIISRSLRASCASSRKRAGSVLVEQRTAIRRQAPLNYTLGGSEMPACPHCCKPIDLRKIKHQGFLASYRVCPTCDQAFEVDPKTKMRQAAFMVLALISLVLTVLMYRNPERWLSYALFSYLLLAVAIYNGNKRVYFVKSQGAKGKSGRH